MTALTIALIGAANIVVASGRSRAVACGSALLLGMMAFSVAGMGVLPTPLLAGLAPFVFCYLMISGQLHDGGNLRLVIAHLRADPRLRVCPRPDRTATSASPPGRTAVRI